MVRRSACPVPSAAFQNKFRSPGWCGRFRFLLGAFPRFQFGDQGGNLLTGELVEFDNSGFLAKLWWH